MTMNWNTLNSTNSTNMSSTHWLTNVLLAVAGTATVAVIAAGALCGEAELAPRSAAPAR